MRDLLVTVVLAAVVAVVTYVLSARGSRRRPNLLSALVGAALMGILFGDPNSVRGLVRLVIAAALGARAGAGEVLRALERMVSADVDEVDEFLRRGE